MKFGALEPTMEVKPVPKPRTIFTLDKPVPAPRVKMLSPILSRTPSPSESSQSERSDESKSESRGLNAEFFRSLGSSSRQLKEGLSEKMTVKGRALISSSRNASIRLEKSVKNLLTKRLTSLPQTDTTDGAEKREEEEERCVSLPIGDDIFNSISFYSPLHGKLKRCDRNEENLAENRYSPPPPVYPPPPLPDESIYDEVQSVNSSHSSRYDTLSSTFSERVEGDFGDGFDTLNSRSRTTGSESSGRSSSTSTDVLRSECEKRLSRSDSWNFYDATPTKVEEGAKCEVFQPQMTLMEEIEVSLTKNREKRESNASNFSVQNSLYENWMPLKNSIPVPEVQETKEPKSRFTKSVILEFDPFAGTPEACYENNNDLVLLQTLLAASDSPSSHSSGSVCESVEEEVLMEQEDGELSEDLEPVSAVPPMPPRRFDSLPKHEYDEVEMVEVAGKNPALLPKLAHLAVKKQPAVPPRKGADDKAETGESSDPTESLCSSRDSDKSRLKDPSSVPGNLPSKPPDDRKTRVMQKLRKLGHGSAASLRPNMLNLARLLPRHKEQSITSGTAEKKKKPKMTRPDIAMTLNPPTHRSILYKAGSGIERAKDLVLRHAVLADKKITFYADKNLTVIKEVIQLSTAQSIHLLQDVKNVDGDTVHCIAISGEGRSEFNLIYAKGITERRIWAQKLLETLTPAFPTKYSSDFTISGWAYVKEGVTGSWIPAWVLLQQRTLVYTKTTDPVTLESIDLRKARCIVVREQEGPIPDSENVPVVVVDAGGKGALHLTAPGVRGVPAWNHALYQAATNCGPALDQQQLTQDNVPVILDKCINFIYAHGIMTEGIYRRSGSSSAVARLLEALRRDAWATQITRSSYSEHDVATVLRRFLRDLPEPLFPSDIHMQLCLTSELELVDDKVKNYRRSLNRLTPILLATVQRILGHLHCICQKSDRNLMNVENISAIWGPTLMHGGEYSADEWNRSETRVLADMIRLYPDIYQLSKADLAKEARMLEVLEMHVSNNGLRSAPSGDLKVWIYITSKDGECVNVTIGPQKTAFDVCRELAAKTCTAPHELCLEEYCLHGSLERPLHHNEKVLEVVARWGYWDSEDRKDNVLILKKDRIYKELVPQVKPPMTISGELKFADTRAKNFKTYLFEFSQAKLSCYKDKSCSVKLHEWKIEDIVWYLGHETKRNPQMGWSVTFIVKNKKPTRCKESPYFGYTLAGASKEEQYRWLAAMLFGEYQLNLRPSPVNLMDD